MVAWALRGAMLPDFEMEDREQPFWINYGDRVKENVEELSSIRVFRPGNEPVRLDNLARYSMVPGSGEIHRQNGKMTVGFSARVKGDFPSVKERVERHFSRFPVPEGFEITLRQEARGFQQDFKNLMFATALALLLVFFVMGVLFESFLLPLSVLFSIPHAFFGSILLLWILRIPLDMVGLLGVLMLVGIVVNNAIVLVDCVNRLRLQGMERTDAIVRSVEVRFRPIWMTALTTIFGLVPLLLFPPSGDGMDYRALAVVLVGGLTTSTFFTLFVVPLFYSLLDDLRRWARFSITAARQGQKHLP
jgi:HAE1 family hydrophobic/amphiphilic exporter-1